MTTIQPSARDIALTRKWASFYASRGFNPLPARADEKRPLVRFAQWWDEPAPDDLFDRHPTTNVQLMTGRRWRLLVLDLDGPEGRNKFEAMAEVECKSIPRTWATHSGGDGMHLWFLLPTGYRRELPKAFLWKGSGKHASIERLCDHSLIMVPPSIHPKTGERYRFLDRSRSPLSLPMPAPCPAWVLALRPLAPDRATVPYAAPAVAMRVVTARGRFRASDVLDAIPDKPGLARAWGLRVASDRPNGAGWIPCHAIGREDRTPSASISAESGRYWEPGTRTIGLFELAVRLGAYADWRDALADLGDRYRAREVG
jgi:hypothetical protein